MKKQPDQSKLGNKEVDYAEPGSEYFPLSKALAPVCQPTGVRPHPPVAYHLHLNTSTNGTENIPTPGDKKRKDTVSTCPETKKESRAEYHNHLDHTGHLNLLRFSVKKGEYVYARPYDIVLVESCDHLVKVYLLYGDKVRKVVRNSTLKDFLLQLPPTPLVRIGRFCAINVERLSGGSYNEQFLQFDFRVSIKPGHALPQTAFTALGK